MQLEIEGDSLQAGGVDPSALRVFTLERLTLGKSALRFAFVSTIAGFCNAKNVTPEWEGDHMVNGNLEESNRNNADLEVEFPVVDISNWERLGTESVGTNKPVWYLNSITGKKWVYKTEGRKTNTFYGKAWAEKIVCEVGLLLGVACANTQLATAKDSYGSISESFLLQGWEEKAGDLLISEIRPSFKKMGKPHTHHNLSEITRVLSQVAAPPNSPKELKSAFDAFTGFLVLDALTASCDRHVENWAVVIGPDQQSRLAPSWDHGNSLGFNLTSEGMRNILNSGIQEWASKGKAAKFEGVRKAQLTKHALAASALCEISVQEFWENQVQNLDLVKVERIIERVPHMSQTSSVNSYWH